MTGSTLHITSNTVAVSTTSGALTCVGGAGIGLDLYVGGVTHLGDHLNCLNTEDATSIGTGSVTVSGGVSILKALFCGGAITTVDASTWQSTLGIKNTSVGTNRSFDFIIGGSANDYVGADNFGIYSQQYGNIPIKIYGSSGVVCLITLAGGGNRAVYSDSSGNLTNSSSDERLKENITPLSYGLNEINGLQPISFNWKDRAKFGEQKEIGFTAQSVLPIIPEVIGTNHDGMMSLDYSHFSPVLVKAIQELNERINKLEKLLK